MTVQKALILVGSPKASGGTSGGIAEYLALRLKSVGVGSETLHIHRMIEQGQEVELVDAVDRNDAVIIVFPIYFESIPSGVVRYFEAFRERKGKDGGTKKPFYAISNSAVPESVRGTLALEQCVLFARDAGFEWMGGAAVGSGPALEGRTLSDGGGMARNLTAGIGLTAVSVSQSGALSKQARDLIGRPLMPRALYLMMVNRTWKKAGRKKGTLDRLRDKPYA